MSTPFNKTQIKNINIKFNEGEWNPMTHNIVLSYDPESVSGFKVKIISNDEVPITNVSLAQEVLQKFRLK